MVRWDALAPPRDAASRVGTLAWGVWGGEVRGHGLLVACCSHASAIATPAPPSAPKKSSDKLVAAVTTHLGATHASDLGTHVSKLLTKDTLKNAQPVQAPALASRGSYARVSGTPRLLVSAQR